MGITVLSPVPPAPTLYGLAPSDVALAAVVGASLAAAPGDHVHKLADSGWQTPALQNGWLQYDTIWGNAAMYRKIGPLVFCRGLVKSGTLGASIFTLPVGYRPSINMLFASEAADTICRISVQPDGTITTGAGGSQAWTSLCNLIFPADA
jgi:hypothetical protein